MKTTLALLTLSVALASVSNAAITLGGTALKNVQGTTATDLVAGRLGLLIVDTAGDGFLTAFSFGPIFKSQTFYNDITCGHESAL